MEKTSEREDAYSERPDIRRALVMAVAPCPGRREVLLGAKEVGRNEGVLVLEGVPAGGESEVDNYGDTRGGEENICGFYVIMGDIIPVQEGNS